MSKMNQLVHDRLKNPYSRVLIPDEDGTYCAEILEFSGCYAEGETPEEAIRNLESVAASWIEAALEQGQDIPEPLATYGYSGKTNLRLPRSIHKQAARFAKKDDVSLNQFFASAIAARVGAEEFYDHLTKKLEERLTQQTVILNAITIRMASITTSDVPFLSATCSSDQITKEPSEFGGRIAWNNSPLAATNRDLQEVNTDG